MKSLILAGAVAAVCSIASFGTTRVSLSIRSAGPERRR